MARARRRSEQAGSGPGGPDWRSCTATVGEVLAPGGALQNSAAPATRQRYLAAAELFLAFVGKHGLPSQSSPELDLAVVQYIMERFMVGGRQSDGTCSLVGLQHLMPRNARGGDKDLPRIMETLAVPGNPARGKVEVVCPNRMKIVCRSPRGRWNGGTGVLLGREDHAGRLPVGDRRCA